MVSVGNLSLLFGLLFNSSNEMIVIQLAEMDCCPGVRTRNVYGWFSVIWFISAASVAGKDFT